MTTLSPGALVRRKCFSLIDGADTLNRNRPDDPVWAVRCEGAWPGWFHLVTMLEQDGERARTSSVAGTNELELVRAAPTCTPGQHISYEGRHATVLKDYGDGFLEGNPTRIEHSKSDARAAN
jgi:hypothetical protein